MYAEAGCRAAPPSLTVGLTHAASQPFLMISDSQSIAPGLRPLAAATKIDSATIDTEALGEGQKEARAKRRSHDLALAPALPTSALPTLLAKTHVMYVT
mmetsp:Transcript_41424/g.62603  ORF Transcript_41424/g.62603 Transcript_41424/m.62603 type:complete len:99 (-) Transcript_41424:114-410(-)